MPAGLAIMSLLLRMSLRHSRCDADGVCFPVSRLVSATTACLAAPTPLSLSPALTAHVGLTTVLGFRRIWLVLFKTGCLFSDSDYPFSYLDCLSA